VPEWIDRGTTMPSRPAREGCRVWRAPASISLRRKRMRGGMDLQRTDVDGVPALWAPWAGELRAGLVFRVGRADEILATAGITHLVEHLALHQVGVTRYHIAGETSPLTTTFGVRGDVEQVTAFFARVCAALADLPPDRLDIEKAILRTEDNSDRPGFLEPLLGWRYGPATYGAAGLP
jgi:zinc protease